MHKKILAILLLYQPLPALAIDSLESFLIFSNGAWFEDRQRIAFSSCSENKYISELKAIAKLSTFSSKNYIKTKEKNDSKLYSIDIKSESENYKINHQIVTQKEFSNKYFCTLVVAKDL